MSIVDLNAYRKIKPLDEYDVLSMILECGLDEMLIVTNINKQLRVAKVRATRFIVDIEKL
jgi:hypothetical protein